MCSACFSSRAVPGLCESSVRLWSPMVSGRFLWRASAWEQKGCPGAQSRPGSTGAWSSTALQECGPERAQPVGWAWGAVGGSGTCFQTLSCAAQPSWAGVLAGRCVFS